MFKIFQNIGLYNLTYNPEILFIYLCLSI